MTREQIEDAKKEAQEAIEAVRKANVHSREQLIEVVEEILRHLKRDHRIRGDGYEATFLNPPPFS